MNSSTQVYSAKFRDWITKRLEINYNYPTKLPNFNRLINFFEQNCARGDKNFATASSISVISSLVAGYCKTYTSAKLTQYNFLIADAGWGKESYTSIAENIISEIFPNRILSEPQSMQALQRAMLEYNIKYLSLDEGIHLFKSICASNASEVKANLLSGYLSLWDNKDKLKKLITKLKENDTAEVRDPHLNILAAGIPDGAKDLCSMKLFNESGMISRCNFIFPLDGEDNRNKNREKQLPKDFLDYISLLKKIKSQKLDTNVVINLNSPQIQLHQYCSPVKKTVISESGLLYFKEILKFYDNTEQLYEKQPIFRPFFTRCAEKILRIATAISAFEQLEKFQDDSEKTPIETYDWALHWAHQFMQYLVAKSIVNIFSFISSNQITLIMNLIIDCFLKKNTNELTLRDCYRLQYKLMSFSKSKLMEAIETLEMQNRIIFQQMPKNSISLKLVDDKIISNDENIQKKQKNLILKSIK